MEAEEENWRKRNVNRKSVGIRRARGVCRTGTGEGVGKGGDTEEWKDGVGERELNQHVRKQRNGRIEEGRNREMAAKRRAEGNRGRTMNIVEGGISGRIEELRMDKWRKRSKGEMVDAEEAEEDKESIEGGINRRGSEKCEN